MPGGTLRRRAASDTTTLHRPITEIIHAMRPLLLTVVLALSLWGCASGTDDTTDGDTAAGTPSADQAIPVDGDGGIGDGAGPPAPLAEAPDFGVSSETDSGTASPAQRCWTATPDDGTDPECVEDPLDPQSLRLTADAQLVVTYVEGELLATAGEDLPVVQENPGIWLVDISQLDPGDHVVDLSWVGAQGNALTSLTLDITR
jgi:hypothetical protein